MGINIPPLIHYMPGLQVKRQKKKLKKRDYKFTKMLKGSESQTREELTKF